MDENRITRSIPCHDASGRERSLEVVGEPRRIWLIAPPGGAAGVSPHDYEDLKQALTDALVVSLRGHR